MISSYQNFSNVFRSSFVTTGLREIGLKNPSTNKERLVLIALLKQKKQAPDFVLVDKSDQKIEESIVFKFRIYNFMY